MQWMRTHDLTDWTKLRAAAELWLRFLKRDKRIRCGLIEKITNKIWQFEDESLWLVTPKLIQDNSHSFAISPTLNNRWFLKWQNHQSNRPDFSCADTLHKVNQCACPIVSYSFHDLALGPQKRWSPKPHVPNWAMQNRRFFTSVCHCNDAVHSPSRFFEQCSREWNIATVLLFLSYTVRRLDWCKSRTQNETEL